MVKTLILLSLTLQISALVDEIKGKKAYFNFTENTIERVNTCRNMIVGLMIPVTNYIMQNKIINVNHYFLCYPVIASCIVSCFIVGKPASEQPLPPIKKTVAVSVCDRDLMQHNAKNPLVGNVNPFFVNNRAD